MNKLLSKVRGVFASDPASVAASEKTPTAVAKEAPGADIKTTTQEVMAADSGFSTPEPSQPSEPLPVEPRQAPLSDEETVETKILTALQELSDRFDRKIRADGVREQMFNALHEQLKRQNADQEYALKKGMYRSLFLLHDSITQARQRVGGNTGALTVLDDLGQELLDLLDSENIERMEILNGVSFFDRTQQKALSQVPTENPADDFAIERVVKDGFRQGERVLRPQNVVVRRCQTAPQEPAVMPNPLA